MAKIPQHIIDEILARVDIVDLVGEHVNLRRRGQNYFGLCPFHSEKTPSFSVNPAKGIFHCFGCKAGGNAITFLTLHDNIGFMEALEELARRVGVELPKIDARTEQEVTEQELLIKANEMARDFFHKTLTERKAPGTDDAWKFLESRGYSPDIVKAYKLGYVSDQWDSFLKYATANGMAQKILHRAGLIVTREKESGYYDRFRHRVMFPIENLSGKVVGFGGRTLSDDPETPKYLNSSDSTVFQKSQLLYGIRQARVAIRQHGFAILVEGYTDALALWIAGIGQAVATLGTAFGEQQARLLARYCSEIILTYDGDEAGLRAALRTGDIVLSQGLTPRVLLMPEGEDPDSFIRGHGAEAFNDMLNSAPAFLHFKWKLAEQTSKVAPRGKSAQIRWVLESVGRIPKELERNLALKEVAQLTGLPEGTLARELSALRRATRTQNATDQRATATTLTISQDDYPSLELLKILVHHSDLATKVFLNWEIKDIDNKNLRKFVKDLEQRYRSNSTLSEAEIISLAEDAGLRNWIAEVMVSSGTEEPERAAHDCLIRIRCMQKEHQLADLLARLKNAESQDEDPVRYLLQINQIRQEISALKHQRLWEITL
jgi:DNA primase